MRFNKSTVKINASGYVIYKVPITYKLKIKLDCATYTIPDFDFKDVNK